ncbi:MAG: hypothetical protein ACKOEM_08670 [Planctomycetia bacterium]
MNALVLSIVAAVSMALVAAACTVLCLAWSIPAWRRRLGGAGLALRGASHNGTKLAGLPLRVASGLVSTGLAACAIAAWYGCGSVVAAVIAASR